jgi:hypothetical protein
MVGYLKDMGRLNSFVCKVEAIALANLARELQGQLQRLFPDKQFTFDWHWAAPTIVGDSRVFLHAISELCKAFYTGAATSCVVQATSRQHGGAIQLSFNIRNQFMPDCQLMDHAEPVAPACPLSERLEIILAREWLALCGSDVEILGHGETEAVFSIVTPSR